MPSPNTKISYALLTLVVTAGAALYGYHSDPDAESGNGKSSIAGRSQSAGIVTSHQPGRETSGPTREEKNHLGNETSPYLLLHATNPVWWYPWGEAAFAKARREGKPIFLSVGYSTCYWCHVMERESFSQDEVARLLNENFVSIKVDREERPDVDEIYMTALQMMGQRGGWPMSMFLTPDLKPFYGGTYFPKPDFMELLVRVRGAWQEHRTELTEAADRLANGLGRLASTQTAVAVPGDQPIALVAEQLRGIYDAENGGFGAAPKFPQPVNLELLLTLYERSGNAADLTMVTRTLDAMARGGIYDQVGRGFHRYSTDEHWRVPHFEKMLYDNAQLLHVYARALSLTGAPLYRRIALETADFIEGTMTGPDGLFFSAMDSETDAEEGRYYIWTRAEIRSLLTQDEFRSAETVWGLNRDPFFDGKYVLYWPEDYGVAAKALGLDVPGLFLRLEPIRDKLLAYRQRRQAPLMDDKVITAWNGMTIESLAFAGRILEEPELIARAERAAAALLEKLRTGKGLKHVYRQGTVKLDAYLDDYAATILALVEIHRTTGADSWRQSARAVADEMIDRLWDADAGGFFYAQHSADNLLVRSKAGFDGAVPSGNSLAVKALTRLSALGDERYGVYASGTLKANGAQLERAPAALVAMVEGLAEYRRAARPLDAARVPRSPKAIPAESNRLSSEAYVAMQAKPGDRQGATQRLEIELAVVDGWHINANPSSLDFLVPTTIAAERDGHLVKIGVDYPAGRRIDVGLGERIAVYSGTVLIPVAVESGDLSAGDTGNDLKITARVQACNDTGRCLLPADISTTLGGD
ncbi:MAG: DUF255 domain-containing protein [Gammaproteobacteria bacterium]|nr:DUF255 domain-containing protein [Gammaproteobacteria bacterium]